MLKYILVGDNASGLYYRDYNYYGGGASIERHVLYAFNNIVYGNKVKILLLFILKMLKSIGLQFIQNLEVAIEQIANLSFDYTYNFDPAFKDSANGDFSLSNLSQALGRGICKLGYV